MREPLDSTKPAIHVSDLKYVEVRGRFTLRFYSANLEFLQANVGAVVSSDRYRVLVPAQAHWATLERWNRLDPLGPA